MLMAIFVRWNSKMSLFNVLFLCALRLVAECKNDDSQKRLVLHSEGDVAGALQLMSVEIAGIQANLSVTQQELSATKQDLSSTKHELTVTKQELHNTKTALAAQGSTFVRWGRTICPNNTDIVYKGFTAGGLYSETGAAADYICLAGDPTWGYFDSSNNNAAGHLHGTEYQFTEQKYRAGGADFFGQNMYEHDAPCCVCRSNLPTTIMIPGRNQCYPGWTTQYAGYLVGGSSGHLAASNYACLDSRPEVELGDSRNDNGKLMYTVEAVCGSLKCPPYVQGREITCVVCSK